MTAGIMPASPTTLVTLLKAVAYGWQQERLAESTEQLRALGLELYDRVRTLATHFAGVRKGLETAVETYNKTVGSPPGTRCWPGSVCDAAVSRATGPASCGATRTARGTRRSAGGNRAELPKFARS